MLTMQINLNAASVFDGNIQSSLVEVSLAVHDKVRFCLLLSSLLYISNLPRKDVQCSVFDRKNNGIVIWSDLHHHKIIYTVTACPAVYFVFIYPAVNFLP